MWRPKSAPRALASRATSPLSSATSPAPSAEPSAFLAMSLEPGMLLAGRYMIRRAIGRGGMGEVYEAHDRLLNEAVALKTLRSDLAGDDGVGRRFQKEIQLARRVSHPNVCRIFDAGEHEDPLGGRPLRFFTMELLAGETLWARIHRLGRLTRTDAFPIAAQMAEGLQAAHEAGVVHADFKSGNVVLVPAPGGERVVITDFGLARILPAAAPPDETRTLTVTQNLVGTVAYMSPEQLRGATVAAASDIYSFGIVLFEMATGRRPFDDRHVINAAVQRVSGEGVAARSLVPDLDSHWAAAIERCLQKDPARRFASAADLADWFRQDRWRLPRLYWTRRQWIRASAGAAVLAAATVDAWMWWRRPYQPKPAAAVWNGQGLSALHSMAYEAARKAFEQAVAADPAFAPAHAGLARAYDELDYTERAKEQMLRAVALAEDSRLSNADAVRLRAVQFLVARDYARATPLYQQLEEQASREEKPAAALESGWLAQQQDDTEGAAAAYQRALRLEPNYAAARLRLGYIQGRRREVNAALQNFSEAERLFQAASDYEGVTESLLQRASLLNRSGRSADALPVIERALAAAGTLGNTYQQIRLEMLQGVAVRNLGDPARAAALAQQAVDHAIAQNMDNLAAVGLMDLGNSFLVAGDLASAEPVLRRALNLAERSGVRRAEARARASLASVYLEAGRPEEAKPYIAAVLPFYRQAGYRRELVQTMTLLGTAHQQLGELDEAVPVLREALTEAARLQDPIVESSVRERLGGALREQGGWPEALAQYERARALLGPRGVTAQIDAADLAGRLGRREDAERSLTGAARLLEQNPDRPSFFRLRLVQAQLAYGNGEWPQAAARARQALALRSDNASAALMEALVRIRSGSRAEGAAAAEAVIAKFDQDKSIFDAAEARLSAAEALAAVGGSAGRARALRLAQEALAFAEPRKLFESVWRAHAVASQTTAEPAEARLHAAASAAALAQLRLQWRSDFIEGYLQRPEIRPLARGVL